MAPQYETRLILPSVVIGIGLSAVLQVAALIAYEQGFSLVTRILDWPNTVVQAVLAGGSPVNLLAYFASLPLGVAVYATGAYFFLMSRIGRSR